ncbi:MAG: hypothetical protein KC983_12720 [Phycisphaerales bacterium]|nr:hypothetical protein [Phycisphaerales bacterium]
MANLRMHRFAIPAALGVIAGLSLSGMMMSNLAVAQDAPPIEAPPSEQPDFGAMLVQGLKNTPGCLAVDLGSFESGKQSIFAWFENKAAVKAWYYSRTHMGVMNMVMGDDEAPPPLAYVDEDGPILVIASITPSADPKLKGFPMPIDQISIELFRALPGGAHVNGRLSPETFIVPHMRDYTAAVDANSTADATSDR